MGIGYGYFKGEKCNRNGCDGIINDEEKEGCCSCHINSPCDYCIKQTEYCPVCGWNAEEEQDKYIKNYIKGQTFTPFTYKSDEERFKKLKDEEFGYIQIASGSSIIKRIKGKHPNLSRSEIYKRLHLGENPEMPRMKRFTEYMFELTYFCD